MNTSSKAKLLQHMTTLISELNDYWGEDEMWLRIKLEEGKWTIEIGDGCNDGESQSGDEITSQMLNEALEEYLL